MSELITTVKVEKVGGHEHVHIWNRGGKAGVLVVTEGDGALIEQRLLGAVEAKGLVNRLVEQAAMRDVLWRDQNEELRRQCVEARQVARDLAADMKAGRSGLAGHRETIEGWEKSDAAG